MIFNHKKSTGAKSGTSHEGARVEEDLLLAVVELLPSLTGGLHELLHLTTVRTELLREFANKVDVGDARTRGDLILPSGLGHFLSDNSM